MLPASTRRRDHPQVTTAANLRVDRGEVLPTRHRAAGLPYGFGERDKIVHAVRRRIEFALVPDKIPAARSGETPGVLFAEIVRVWFGERGERTDDGGRVGVDVGQRRDGKPGAAVPGATPWRPHRRTLSPRAADRWLRHAAIRRRRWRNRTVAVAWRAAGDADWSPRGYAHTVSSPDRARRRPGSPSHRDRRDRHGRGLRGRLVPANVPLFRTKSEIFDDLVLDAIEGLERTYSRELAGVEFAVEDVPPDLNVYDSDVLEDGEVPLARLLPGAPGRPSTPARIVLYRRPLEFRAIDNEDLADLVHDVIIEQVANLLGIDPEEMD